MDKPSLFQLNKIFITIILGFFTLIIVGGTISFVYDKVSTNLNVRQAEFEQEKRSEIKLLLSEIKGEHFIQEEFISAYINQNYDVEALREENNRECEDMWGGYSDSFTKKMLQNCLDQPFGIEEATARSYINQWDYRSENYLFDAADDTTKFNERIQIVESNLKTMIDSGGTTKIDTLTWN
jgi:hypothetical protein